MRELQIAGYLVADWLRRHDFDGTATLVVEVAPGQEDEVAAALLFDATHREFATRDGGVALSDDLTIRIERSTH